MCNQKLQKNIKPYYFMRKKRTKEEKRNHKYEYLEYFGLSCHRCLQLWPLSPALIQPRKIVMTSWVSLSYYLSWCAWRNICWGRLSSDSVLIEYWGNPGGDTHIRQWVEPNSRRVGLSSVPNVSTHNYWRGWVILSVECEYILVSVHIYT